MCSQNPSQDFSNVSSTYHSATPCLTRRVNTVVARNRDNVIGSSAASSTTPAGSSSCSTRVP
ncbi:hypothetical protein [Protofrankia sp. BMG5.30]|uniref:hypothetical protein n=1 Tax=Protofrankia sp. BMG5.30 TaxID=1834514 RepID=UPI0009774CB5|nr:hypothetical protein [Protofrankia sp. BMG5.30]ONH31816.1 hypothetical protein BL254_22500 [Protofrankia sp. BMG5.30]